MKKILLLLLLLQISFTALAQQYKYHIVKKGETVFEIARMYNISEETLYKYNPDARKGIAPESKLVVPISGTTREQAVKFETHRVKKKETLFSLSQKYNVEIEDIKRYNKHLYSQELRRGEKIKIPIIEKVAVREDVTSDPPASNPLDLTAKEHVVLPQETLYGISRKYNITIAELQRLNPTMENLQPGMVLKVRNGSAEKVIDVEGRLFKYYQVQPQETLFSLTRRFGISKDSLVSLNPALEDGLKSGMVLKIPNPEVDANIIDDAEYAADNVVNLERRLNNFSTKNLVVMLPFSLDKIVTTDTTSNTKERIKKDPVLQISLDFYSGVLMAIDSAKTLGLSTNVRFFDTQQNPSRVRSIISVNNFNDVDAVIGPLLQSSIEAAASALEGKNIPVISPLTKKQAGSMNNFLQSLPTDEMLSEAMISYISNNSSGKNIVLIADAGASAKKNRLLSAFPSAKIVTPRDASYVNQQELQQALVKGRPNWVIIEASKIGILSNATSYLNALANNYDITLMTTDKNKSYESDNISNRHLSNLNFTYPSVEKAFSTERNISFIKNYKEKYGVVPNKYAVRGFDVTYDVLLRLGSSQDLYSSLDGESTTQYVENKFSYERRPVGGFQNKAVYIVRYDKEMNLKVVQ